MDQKSTHQVSQYKKWENELNMEGLVFPMSLKHIDKFERLNTIEINNNNE